jgi:hypothetical protein
MKIILFYLLLFSIQPAFSQDLSFDYANILTKNNDKNKVNLFYDIRGKYDRAVKKSTLKDAKVISDFVPGFPVNWISNYGSVELVSVNKNKMITATGKNEVLTAEQKNLLMTADLSTNLILNVHDEFKNPVTYKNEDRKIKIQLTVVPEYEAEFIGGRDEMRKYLKRNIIEKISAEISEKIKNGAIGFVINENGKVSDARISISTGFYSIDQLIIEAVYGMPTWKAAKDINGKNVKQEFEFKIQEGGC